MFSEEYVKFGIRFKGNVGNNFYSLLYHWKANNFKNIKKKNHILKVKFSKKIYNLKNKQILLKPVGNP